MILSFSRGRVKYPVINFLCVSKNAKTTHVDSISTFGKLTVAQQLKLSTKQYGTKN